MLAHVLKLSRACCEDLKILLSLIRGRGRLKDSVLLSAASTDTYTKNFKDASLEAGVLSQAFIIVHDRSIYKTIECKTYTELRKPTWSRRQSSPGNEPP
ncbi:hypothetical protein F4778DRAFT_716838, partial [Xylariomycetidae sp. FL2044]